MEGTLRQAAGDPRLPYPRRREIQSPQAYAIRYAAPRGRLGRSEGAWQIEVSIGENLTARCLITALGLLAKQNYSDIKGIDPCKGEMYHTSKWPQDFDPTGKRAELDVVRPVSRLSPTLRSESS
jgi:cation diffusion facilitator CzcD-associated flavoprotein CzcO